MPTKQTIRSEDPASYSASKPTGTGWHSPETVAGREDDIIAAALEILSARMALPKAYVREDKDALAYLRLKVGGLEHEVFGVIFLDNRHGIIGAEEIFRGTIDGASVWPREVAKECLLRNAAAVVLYHNHPSGRAEPSNADHAITRRLVEALKLIDVRVLDHLIICAGEHYSFAGQGLL